MSLVTGPAWLICAGTPPGHAVTWQGMARDSFGELHGGQHWWCRDQEGPGPRGRLPPCGRPAWFLPRAASGPKEQVKAPELLPWCLGDDLTSAAFYRPKQITNNPDLGAKGRDATSSWKDL